MNESAPGEFDKTVGALSLGRSCNDLGLVVVDPSEALAPHNFFCQSRHGIDGGGGRHPREIGRGR